MPTINIDGTEYESDNLSDKAKAELGSIQAVDAKHEALNADVAIYQTARNAYANSLQAQLPEKTASASKKKDVITIDDKNYAIEDFSDEAKAELGSMQFVDNQLAELQAQIAVIQTARIAYANALKAELPADKPAPKKVAAKK